MPPPSSTSQAAIQAANAEAEKARFLAECVEDPLLFVLGAFPWGAGVLAATDRDPEPGPDAWQVWVLEQIKLKHFTVEEALPPPSSRIS